MEERKEEKRGEGERRCERGSLVNLGWGWKFKLPSETQDFLEQRLQRRDIAKILCFLTKFENSTPVKSFIRAEFRDMMKCQ